MGRKLVCMCNLVAENEIVSYLDKGAESTRDIQKFTRAGTTCGKCLTEIDQLVDEYKKTKPEAQQKKLDLGF